MQQRRELEEGAEDAAVHRGERGVADDLPPEGQHALERAVGALDLDAEEARVGDRVDDPAHSPPPCFARISRSNVLSLRWAPSMTCRARFAKGSLPSVALPRDARTNGGTFARAGRKRISARA
jgi:hypothetical protein